MSKKYIPEQIELDFVYPNNDISIYDVDNIIHPINNNIVSGTVSGISATTVSTTGLTFSCTFTWNRNNAEIFVKDNGYMPILSVHMMTPLQDYTNPWRMIGFSEIPYSGYSGSSSFTQTRTFTALQDEMGNFGVGFSNGTYPLEFRFIGHDAVYAVCDNLIVTGATEPTPTPTLTPTPTPTLTPTIPPPTPTPTLDGEYKSGITLNVTDTGWIKYTMQSGTTYFYVGSTGTVTLTPCIICESIAVGIPFADLATFTVTNCGNPCSAPPPTPTPTPTQTGVTVTNAFGYMEPCIGGTIDDYMGATVILSSNVTTDTSFDVTVFYTSIGQGCNPATNYSQNLYVTVPSGSNISNFNACNNGAYFPSGAQICGICINGVYNENVPISFGAYGC